MYRDWAATDGQTYAPSQYSASPYSNSNYGATYDSGRDSGSGSGSGYGSASGSERDRGGSYGQGYSAPQPMASSPSPYSPPLGPSPLALAYAQASAAYSDIERGSGSGSGPASGSSSEYGSGPMPMQQTYAVPQGHGASAPSYATPYQQPQQYQYQQQQQQRKPQRAPAYPALKTPIVLPSALHSVSPSASHSASHSTSPIYTTPKTSAAVSTFDFVAYQQDKQEISKTDDRTLTPRSDLWNRQWCIYEKHADLHFYYKARDSVKQLNVLAIGFEFNQRTRGTSEVAGILIWSCKQGLMRTLLSDMSQPQQPFKLKIPKKASERYTGDFFDMPHHTEDYPTLRLHLEHCSLERLKQLLDCFCKNSNINRQDVQVLEQCYSRGLARAQVIRAALDQDIAQKRAQNVRTYEIPQLELKRGEQLKLDMNQEDRTRIVDKMFTEYTAVHGLNGFSRPEAKQRWLTRLKDSAIDHYIKTGEI